MKRISLMMFCLLVCVLSVTAYGQTPMIGAGFGLLMEDNHELQFTGSMILEQSLSGVPVLNALLTRVEMSGLYADREYNGAEELYAVRAFTTREFYYLPSLYVSLGGGVWQILNSGGSDENHTAMRLELGWLIPVKAAAQDIKADYMRLSLGGEIVYRSQEPDMFLISFGVGFQ